MFKQRLVIPFMALIIASIACRQSAAPTASPAEPGATPIPYTEPTIPAQGIPPTVTAEPTIEPISNAGHTITGQIISGGVTRTYRLHIPANAQRNRPAPLILNFHGLTSSGQEQETLSGMSPKADIYGYFVAYPDGLDQHWNVAPGREGEADLQFVRDLIQAISSSYPIDPRQIYATGISNGGGMANRLACDISDVIAAIAPVSGAFNAWKNCNPSRPVPVLEFHGLDDQIAPYEGAGRGNVEPPIHDWASAWAERNGCNHSPIIVSQVSTMTVEQWNGCKANASVTLYTLSGHGHSWPGTTYLPATITSFEVNATDQIMQFFQNYPMP